MKKKEEDDDDDDDELLLGGFAPQSKRPLGICVRTGPSQTFSITWCFQSCFFVFCSNSTTTTATVQHHDSVVCCWTT
jgi:hypothetical protein